MKSIKMSKRKEEKSSYPYPSRYGSHKSMVVGEGVDYVLLRDEFGEYKTTREMLDSGMTDPKRTDGRRLQKLYSGKKE